MGMAKSEGGFRLRLPPPKELAKIAAVTAAFSIASGILIKALPEKVSRHI
jgi:hypothetical protein